MKEKLAKLAELLLDTGKRNNLINFKDNKTNTVEIVAPSFDAVVKKLANAYVFEAFDPKLDGEDEGGRLTDARLKEILKNKGQYISKYECKLSKTSQILAYNSSASPIKALKNIEKRWRSAIDETGVNIAYLAIGFIRWNEEDKLDESYLAPILLAPISLARKSNVDPYRISVYVDDIILNPTFAYKLQSEFNIVLPEYDDGEDDNIKDYLLRVGEMIAKLKWQVEYTCKIGLFSFLKINMYRDLKDNADIIVQNGNIQKMLGGTFTANQADSRGGAEAKFNVVDADSSQLKAIEMAKSGESFVLQGPPGTGKSQTITNIIAECIADGKKVLFVSEKLAALNVVYNKLKQVGLEDFCLQLHSHKANKKDFIQELCRTMRLEKSGVSSKAAQEEDRLNKSHVILDNYVDVLHGKIDVIDKSLFGLIQEVCACKNSVELDYFVKDVKQKGDKYVASIVDLLEQYAEYSQYIGYDYKEHTWYGYEDKDISLQRKYKVKKSVGAIKDICQDAEDIADDAYTQFGIEKMSTFYQLEYYGNFFNFICKSTYLSPKILDKSKAKRAKESLEKLRPLAESIKQLRQTLANDFSDGILQLDGKAGKELLTKCSGVFSRLFDKNYKTLIAQLKSYSKTGKVNYKQALSAVGILQEIQEKIAEFDSKDDLFKKALSPKYQGVDSDWGLLDCELSDMEYFVEVIDDFGALSLKSYDEFSDLAPTLGEYADRCMQIFLRVEDEEEFVDSFDKDVFDIKDAQFDYLFKRMCRCQADIDSIDNWNRFAVIYYKLKSGEVLDFVDAAIAKGVAVNDYADVFKRIFYMQWIDEVIQKDEFLQIMNRVTHDKTVGIFCEKDVRNFEISKAKIRSLLSSLRPDLNLIAPGSAVANLLNEGGKKRRLKSIRVLLGEIRELAQTLKPCFLMSPLSVSTYLAQDVKFDVVIFDEASQIFPQDAIGAIYRGSQVIVVGDSKQMPPSNFFVSIADQDEDDEDYADAKDFESVLDLCSTVLPQLRLKWHYRSRYESLIDFSNKQFYDGDLVTFPSSKVDAAGIGVDYHYVDGGTFDHKSRTNRAEAEYIVDLVFDNIDKYPDRSLGVVAFSISQQDLIENLIAKRRLADPSKEEFFATDKQEQFFVKNLETVQGDERDTIIFSIAYGKDKDGKMSHNFGPVNRVGGERRLNVAITRAKLNVQLVASIHDYDIDLKNSASVGARLLKEYIGYAERGAVASESADVTEFGEGDMFEFEMEVAQFLRSKGYDVDTKIGASVANVDMGVRLPNGEDYILAVECDGRAYKNAGNTRDRDRLRGSVLQRMGWHYHRVWAIDWIKNKKDEKERLLQAVKDAAEFPSSNVESVHGSADIPDSFEECIESGGYQFPTYRTADLEKAKAAAGADYQLYVRKVLEKEAPLSEELFLKRSIRDFSREKLTDAVWDKFNRLMSRCQVEGIVRSNGFMFIKNRDVEFRVPSEDFVRELKFISLEELGVGMSEIIRKNVSVERMGLYKLLATLLGFSKLGEAMVRRFDGALQLIKDVIDVDGEMLSIKG